MGAFYDTEIFFSNKLLEIGQRTKQSFCCCGAYIWWEGVSLRGTEEGDNNKDTNNTEAKSPQRKQCKHREWGYTGGPSGATGSRFTAQGARITRGCWGRALRGCREELKSPLSGRGHRKRWPSSSTSSGAVGRSVVVTLWGSSMSSSAVGGSVVVTLWEAHLCWSSGFDQDSLVSPLHREQTCLWLQWSL